MTNKSLQIAIAKIQREVVERCAKAAAGGYVSNEPDGYGQGRWAAADAVRELLSHYDYIE